MRLPKDQPLKLGFTARTHNDSLPTPMEFYEYLDSEFHFDFDPCPMNADFDGLKIEWGSCNFVNPPYSDGIVDFIKKGLIEMEKGKKSYFLVPARISGNYWWDLVWEYASEIRLFRQGIKFGTYKKQCPMPLALIEFDPAKTRLSEESGKENKGPFVPRHFSYFKICNKK